MCIKMHMQTQFAHYFRLRITKLAHRFMSKNICSKDKEFSGGYPPYIYFTQYTLVANNSLRWLIYQLRTSGKREGKRKRN